MAHNPPAVLHVIPDDIRVFWINDYECWAGRSMEECIEASMREFGVAREEAFDEDSAREIRASEWGMQIPNSEDEIIKYKGRGRAREIDWDRTPWCTLSEMIGEHAAFPALIGIQE